MTGWLILTTDGEEAEGARSKVRVGKVISVAGRLTAMVTT